MTQLQIHVWALIGTLVRLDVVWIQMVPSRQTKGNEDTYSDALPYILPSRPGQAGCVCTCMLVVGQVSFGWDVGACICPLP